MEDFLRQHKQNGSANFVGSQDGIPSVMIQDVVQEYVVQTAVVEAADAEGVEINLHY